MSLTIARSPNLPNSPSSANLVVLPMTICGLEGDRYRSLESSMAFPVLDVTTLQRFLDLRQSVKENALIRQVREWAEEKELS